MSQAALTGLGLALVAAMCFDGGYALQALEARSTDAALARRPSLLTTLLRRRRWLIGTLLGIAAWGLQIGALRLAPVTLVQPAVACGVLLLLALGPRVLGEPVGRRDVAMAIGLLAGVAGVALAAPARDPNPGTTGLLVAVIALTLVALLPYALRSRGAVLTVSAAAADAVAVLVAREVGDELAAGRWGLAVLWAAGAGAAVLVGLTSEMTALQRLPATRVGPAVLAGQVAVPVVLAPVVFGEDWSATPLGGLVLGFSLLVAVACAAGLLARSPAGRIGEEGQHGGGGGGELGP